MLGDLALTHALDSAQPERLALQTWNGARAPAERQQQDSNTSNLGFQRDSMGRVMVILCCRIRAEILAVHYQLWVGIREHSGRAWNLPKGN